MQAAFPIPRWAVFPLVATRIIRSGKRESNATRGAALPRLGDQPRHVRAGDGRRRPMLSLPAVVPMALRKRVLSRSTTPAASVRKPQLQALLNEAFPVRDEISM